MPPRSHLEPVNLSLWREFSAQEQSLNLKNFNSFLKHECLLSFNRGILANGQIQNLIDFAASPMPLARPEIFLRPAFPAAITRGCSSLPIPVFRPPGSKVSPISLQAEDIQARRCEPEQLGTYVRPGNRFICDPGRASNRKWRPANPRFGSEGNLLSRPVPKHEGNLILQFARQPKSYLRKRRNQRRSHAQQQEKREGGPNGSSDSDRRQALENVEIQAHRRRQCA